MKALSTTESRRLERMWNTESGDQERMKQHAEEVVQEVLRRAEEKFQQSKTQPTHEHTKKNQ